MFGEKRVWADTAKDTPCAYQFHTSCMQSRLQCFYMIRLNNAYICFFPIHFIWHWMSVLSYEYKIFPFRYLHCYGLQSLPFITFIHLFVVVQHEKRRSTVSLNCNDKSTVCTPFRLCEFVKRWMCEDNNSCSVSDALPFLSQVVRVMKTGDNVQYTFFSLSLSSPSLNVFHM